VLSGLYGNLPVNFGKKEVETMSTEDPKDEQDNEENDDDKKGKKDPTAKLIYSYPLGPKFKKGTGRK
jgi:hypothetical protein